MANLDPDDVGSLSRFFHEALEAGLDHYRGLEEAPVWQPAPEKAVHAFTGPAPRQGQPVDQLLDHFRNHLIPYTNGNLHPGFFGWVHGGGNLYGALGELCAALLNNNLGGRNHIAHAVEGQVVQWSRELFGFPPQSSGLLVSGTSMASVIALAVARQWALGEEVKRQGVQGKGPVLVGYCSTQTHGALVKAFQLLGLGSESLRRVPVRDDHSLDTGALRESIRNDRHAGLKPFAVIGTVCTVNTGAIDDLAGIADICEEEQLWFHVDAAFGAALALLEEYADDLAGLDRADSVGFDFHKWFQVPYAVGGVLVRDAQAHRSTFSEPVEYLETQPIGLEAGAPWPCDLGPELSRGFLALKVWFTFQGVGLESMAASVRKHCRLARELAIRVSAAEDLECLAPVSSNIVCLRYRPSSDHATGVCSEHYLDALNRAIVTQLQLQGVSAPSTTTLNGCLAIRVAIVNHRTEWKHLEQLLHHTRRIGECLDQHYPTLLNPTHWHFMQGGDGRLIVDPVTGLNRYGCSPAPRDHAFTFASSTASSVSRQAYEVADHYRQQLLHDLLSGGPTEVVPDYLRKLEHQLMDLLGLNDLEASAFLVPSGTDAQLLSVGVTASDPSASWVSVVCGADETGSGTPESVTGRHFDSETCLGVPVTRGERLAGMAPIGYRPIDIHDETGRVRSPREMDAAIEDCVASLVSEGHSVILHAMEQSKLGRWCPSREVMDRLRERFGERLQIIVDACQLRTDREDLRAHLEKGDILLLTGSKFFTGPPFSGAAVFPTRVGRGLANEGSALPEGLSDYITSDALGAWQSMVAGARPALQTGVMLRWRAALAEMARYYAVPESIRVDGLNRFSEQVVRLLREHPLVEPLFAPDEDWWARNDFAGQELSNRRSIFPFLVKSSQRGGYLDAGQARRLYELLNQELDRDSLEPLGEAMRRAAGQCCHIGQPVPLKGGSSAALRISMGARIISDSYAAGGSFEDHLEGEVRQIRMILDKIELCVSQPLL